MKKLSHAEIAFLKKRAHHLKPVVQVGKLGLTDAVVVTVNEALEGRELIKLKFVGSKEERDEIAAACAERTASALVGIIGNIAIIYRPRKDPAKRTIRLPEAGLNDMKKPSKLDNLKPQNSIASNADGQDSIHWTPKGTPIVRPRSKTRGGRKKPTA